MGVGEREMWEIEGERKGGGMGEREMWEIEGERKGGEGAAETAGSKWI